MAEFLACTLFNTSDLALTASDKSKVAQSFAPNSLIYLTEEVCISPSLLYSLPIQYFFTQPWTTHRPTDNSWLPIPALESLIAEIQSDSELKAEVGMLKLKFLNGQAALLPGPPRPPPPSHTHHTLGGTCAQDDFSMSPLPLPAKEQRLACS